MKPVKEPSPGAALGAALILGFLTFLGLCLLHLII
jgi:hypothetical protein